MKLLYNSDVRSKKVYSTFIGVIVMKTKCLLLLLTNGCSNFFAVHGFSKMSISVMFLFNMCVLL